MQEKIFSICEQLSQSGIKTTTERVWEELGGGSFSTISPLIKQWQESQRQVEALPALPAEAQKAVNQATLIIWKMATDSLICRNVALQDT